MILDIFELIASKNAMSSTSKLLVVIELCISYSVTKFLDILNNLIFSKLNIKMNHHCIRIRASI